MTKEKLECEYKKRCENKKAFGTNGDQCWNCERNMKNDLYEDNFREKESK